MLSAQAILIWSSIQFLTLKVKIELQKIPEWMVLGQVSGAPSASSAIFQIGTQLVNDGLWAKMGDVRLKWWVLRNI